MRQPLEFEGVSIHWDGEGSVRVEDRGFTVAVDPMGSVTPAIDPGIVLLTGDSFDPEFLESICGDRTCTVVPESFEGDVPCRDVEEVKTSEILDIYGVEIETYESGSTAYRFVVDDVSVTVVGKIEDYQNLEIEENIDVAFIPMNQDIIEPGDAVKLAVRLKPEIVVPYLYSSVKEGDLKSFSAALEQRSLECEVLQPE